MKIYVFFSDEVVSTINNTDSNTIFRIGFIDVLLLNCTIVMVLN